MSDPKVDVQWSGIRTRLRRGNGETLFLAAKWSGAKGGSQAEDGDVQLAMRLADAATEHNGEPSVNAQGPYSAPQGHLIMVDGLSSEEGLQRWLAALGNSLEQSGRTGTVGMAPTVFIPQQLNRYSEQPQLTAFLALSMTQPLPPWPSSSWMVSDEVTDDLADHATSWGAFPGATTYLSERVPMVILESRAAEPFQRAIRRSASARLLYLAEHPIQSRAISAHSRGQVSYQVGGSSVTWREQLAELRSVMVRAPEYLDAALVHPCSTFGGPWHRIGSVYPKPPGVLPQQLMRYRHLLRTHLPDAYAIQVVTERHLSNANDLSGWNLEPLAAGRYLLEARDVEPWFGLGLGRPEPGMLDQARRDFGGMVITPDLIDEDLRRPEPP